MQLTSELYYFKKRSAGNLGGAWGHGEPWFRTLQTYEVLDQVRELEYL